MTRDEARVELKKLIKGNFNGNMSAAARIAGVSRQYLHEILKRQRPGINTVQYLIETVK